MNLNEYQAKLVELWSTPPDCDHLVFCAVGMAEEAGEALGKVKRLMRGDGFDREGYLNELGDVLAYLTMVAQTEGFKLQDLNSQLPDSKGQVVLYTAFYLMTGVTDLLQAVFEGVHGDEDFKDVIEAKLRSCLRRLEWCATSTEAQSTLEEVMQMNIDKLTDLKRFGR